MWISINRAVCGRCPKCGKGKLFAGFLKVVPACAHCGEPLGHIRADDGPAWLTILIIGHIMLPIIFSFGPNMPLPNIIMMPLLVLVACVLMAAILPLAKGLFVGVVWHQATKQNK